MKPSSADELKTAQAILGEAFGMRGRRPGLSNEELARIIYDLLQKFPLPLILQHEIDWCWCLSGRKKLGVVKEHRIKGRYLDTYESIAQQVDICRQNGITKVIMIAHPLHYWRCFMVARKLGLAVLVMDTSSVPCDECSDQWWTRSETFFIPYEIGARIYYLFTGKI